MSKRKKGYIYKRGDKFAFMFKYNVEIDGEVQKKSISVCGFETEEEATIKYNQCILDFKKLPIDKLEQFDRSKYLPEKKIFKIYSWENVITSYTQHKKNLLKSSSKVVERFILNKLNSLLMGKTINEINNIDFLVKFANSYPLHLSYKLRQVLNYCKNTLEIITTNNMSKVKLPINKNKKIVKSAFYTIDELKMIFSLDDDFALFCKTLYYTGLRKGELLALTFNDIIMKENKIYFNIYKSKYNNKITTTKTILSNREVEIPTFLFRNLMEYKALKKLGNNSLIFSNNCLTIPNIIKENIEHFNFHKFRHTHTSELIKSGMSLKEIQHRLGHSTLQTTLEIYGHYMKNNATIESYIKEI